MPRAKRRRMLDRGDTTPERLAKAGGYTFVDDQRRRQMRDAPIDRALSRGVITSKQYTAAVLYREHWYGGGLCGYIGTLEPDRIFHGRLNFSGLAKTEDELHHRNEYRKAVQHIGQMHAATLDRVVCLETTLERWGSIVGEAGSKTSAIRLAEKFLKDALNGLCGLWKL